MTSKTVGPMKVTRDDTGKVRVEPVHKMAAGQRKAAYGKASRKAKAWATKQKK